MTDFAPLPKTMSGVVLTGHGGFDKLEFRTNLPVPEAGVGEVLIRMSASAINNTDINTRIGWYSKGVKDGTSEGGSSGFTSLDDEDASWTGEALAFLSKNTGGKTVLIVPPAGAGETSR